jgi:phage terminase small subunit
VKLTERQKRFADLYIELGNASEAARQAGYSPKTAFRSGQENMQKPAIKSYIDERIAEKDSKRIAKQDEVLEYLTSIMRGEQREQVLKGVGMGEQEIDEIDVAANQRIRAAELLGKRYGLFKESHQIEGVQQVVIQNDLDD